MQSRKNEKTIKERQGEGENESEGASNEETTGKTAPARSERAIARRTRGGRERKGGRSEVVDKKGETESSRCLNEVADTSQPWERQLFRLAPTGCPLLALQPLSNRVCLVVQCNHGAN